MEICRKIILLILFMSSFAFKNSFCMKEEAKNYSANEFWKTCGLFTYIPYKENPSEITPIRVAFHEAGHALIAKYYDRKIKSITIKESQQTYGDTVCEEGNFKTLENIINFDLAGYITETIKFVKATHIIEGDLDKAATYALFIESHSFLTKKTALQALEQCLTETHKIISENLGTITTIARALLQKETLTGEEINLIFNSSIDTNKQ